ncbi:MAG: dicarboxylate/amino acid:cation symporter, partial [Sphingomonadales bacterium]|nr:dicarboxylate/amino acid:cation symporter [Sphingomonadales bacterium]
MNDAAEIVSTGTPTDHSGLQWRILIGFVVGLVAGLLAFTFAPGAAWITTMVTYVTNPIGQIFLRLLFMLVIPLLVSALIVGIAEMGEIRALRKVGIATLIYTVIVSGIAVALSLLLVNLIRPGDGIDREAARELLERGGKSAAGIVESSSHAQSGVDAVVGLIPSNVITAMSNNDILAVMFFALFFGIGLLLVQTPRTETLKHAIEGVFEVAMRLIGVVIQLAPLAIFCFMFNLAAELGWDLLFLLDAYVGVVL